ncbi:Aspartate aminotransferase [Venturia nashicola]|nr:Aspartate aminotransferase [Venturia nashicola]
MVSTRRQSRMARESPSPQKQTESVVPPPTPKTLRGPLSSIFNSITHRTPKTPKQKSPIKPDGLEMHPAHHHKTATPYDEARWLGFFKMGTHQEPAKPATPPAAVPASPTPMKSPIPDLNAVPSPNFNFTFARDRPKALSAAAQALLAETEEETARVRAELIANMPKVPESALESAAGRKMAKPKGKAGRFSDVHMAAFKKMDSIANHPSAWRLDPNRKKPATTAVQAGFSKFDVDQPAARSLKRSTSKAELDADSAAHSHKHAPSRAELGQGPKSLPRMPSTSTLYKPTMASLKRAPSKPNLNVSRDNTPTRISVSRPASGLPQSSPAKRIKCDMSDDASTNRPVSREGSDASNVQPPVKTIHKGPGLAHQKSGLLRPGFGNLMTPTKASLARAQSTNNLRGEPVSSLPTLARSKSTKDLSQPQTPEQSKTPAPVAAPTPTPMKTYNFTDDSPVKPPKLPSSPPPMLDQTPARVRSILRTPNRRYTRDPAKIAAGTHLSTPPSQLPVLRVAPATVPARKHVNFTASTKEVEMEDADTMVDQRDTTKSASVEPEVGAVRYPDLFSDGNSPRRTTVSDLRMPGAFTFRSGHEVSFSSIKNSTIRSVRSSDVGVSSLSFPPKRKLGAMDTLGEDREGEESSKENRDDEDEYENRPTKKAKMSVAPPAAAVAPTPRKSKLPTRKGVRGSGMTASRLSMLATPKRRK